MKNLLLLAAMLTTAAITSLSNAQAADGKMYPGAVCKRWAASAAGARALERSQFGFVRNTAAQNALGLVCPVIRDSMRAGIERIRVYGSRPQCSQQLIGCGAPSNCILRVMNEHGDNIPSLVRHFDNKPFAVRNWPSIVRNGNQPTNVDFTNIPVPDFTNSGQLDNGSMVVLFCTLTPGSTLDSIYVGEGTGD